MPSRLVNVKETCRRVVERSDPPEYTLDSEGYRCVRYDLLNIWHTQVIVEDEESGHWSQYCYSEEECDIELIASFGRRL